MGFSRTVLYCTLNLFNIHTAVDYLIFKVFILKPYLNTLFKYKINQLHLYLSFHFLSFEKDHSISLHSNIHAAVGYLIFKVFILTLFEYFVQIQD